MAEGNHETVMSALIRSILSQDTNKRGTAPVFVIVLLDGTCPLQSSSLNTQAISAGLSTEMLDPINLQKKKIKTSSFFVLRPSLNIPWVTK
jgi:hypothetical protein